MRHVSLSHSNICIYRYVHTILYVYVTLDHSFRRFQARLKLHFLTHKFFRPNTPGFAIFPRSKARPFSSTPILIPRSHHSLFYILCISIDRPPSGFLLVPSHLPTISSSPSPFCPLTDSHRLKFTRVNHAYLHIVITRSFKKRLIAIARFISNL